MFVNKELSIPKTSLKWQHFGSLHLIGGKSKSSEKKKSIKVGLGNDSEKVLATAWHMRVVVC